MLFQNVQQGAAVDVVVFNAVNGNVGAFGTFVAAAQAAEFAYTDAGMHAKQQTEMKIADTVNSISPSRLFSSRKRWISWRFLALPRAKQELPMQTFIVDPILPPQSADNEWIKYIGNNLKRQQIVCCTEGKNFVSVLIKARKKTVNHLL